MCGDAWRRPDEWCDDREVVTGEGHRIRIV
ncbi:hypothetical protein JXA88_13270 [Candidatus Fermentibacteria bacterium]|nr:hypothetical protein [Candidatus Fermentibacteria bacterium]